MIRDQKEVRHLNFKTFNILTPKACRSSIRKDFGMASANLLQPFGTFGNRSGSIQLLRERFGIYSATFRRPFGEYMPNTCGIHAEYLPNIAPPTVLSVDAERLQKRCRNIPEVAEWIPKGSRTSPNGCRRLADYPEAIPKPKVSRGCQRRPEVFGKPSACSVMRV